MKLRPLKKRLHSAQGMTEYIILVALVALLMIAAVDRFAFSVREAIEGSIRAWEASHPPSEVGATDASPVGNGGQPIGKTSKSGKKVYRVKKVGANTWEHRVGSASGPILNPTTDGNIQSI